MPGEFSAGIVNEETGQTGQAGRDEELATGRGKKLIYLSPRAFHEAVLQDKSLLFDARNAYESRAGFFAGAVVPPIRKFGGLPGYLDVAWPTLQTLMRQEGRSEVLTYCTGGIRCEKGARLVLDRHLTSSPSHTRDGEQGADEITVATLQGGICAYLEWVEEEVEAGRMKKSDSIFRGRNYVFDARGSVGLDEEDTCATGCAGCGTSTARLGKCRGRGCCIVLVLCEGCEVRGTHCCTGCVVISEAVTDERRRKGVCDCEKERESRERAGMVLRAA